MNKLSMPSMITNLGNLDERNMKIVDIALELLQNEQRRILILSERRQQLQTLLKLFSSVNQTAGLYIGGMKENDLKISENKSIILATYAMAAEALDIKTLTTLLMASPKTDVTQSIGRILRTKHIQPLVIDIADYHDIFQAQLKKRIAYYKKQQYNIHIYPDNNIYDYTTLEYKIINKKNKSKCLI